MRFVSYITLGLLIATSAYADVCDYRPSKTVGAIGATSGLIAGGATAAASGTAKAVGVYTLVHATSGLTMVGGTWAGASAAGTAGIIAGTGGIIGSSVAVILMPTVAIPAAIAAVGIAGYESACYFTDTRITDYDEIDIIVRDIALTAPSDLYRYEPATEHAPARIIVRDPDSKEVRHHTYLVENLYIVNGELMHRDWGPNTKIGVIAHITHQEDGKEGG